MGSRDDKYVQDLLELYFEVKAYYILSERLIEKYPISLKNEMNNAFDHLMRALRSKNQENSSLYISEIDSCVRHLKRAGYDCCELIFLYYVSHYQNIISMYSVDVISYIYPKHFTDDIILIDSLKKKVQQIAFDKQHNPTVASKEDMYDEFDLVIKDIEAIYQNVNRITPALENYKIKVNRRKIRETVILLVTAVVFTIIGVILTILLS